MVRGTSVSREPRSLGLVGTLSAFGREVDFAPRGVETILNLEAVVRRGAPYDLRTR